MEMRSRTLKIEGLGEVPRRVPTRISPFETVLGTSSRSRNSFYLREWAPHVGTFEGTCTGSRHTRCVCIANQLKQASRRDPQGRDRAKGQLHLRNEARWRQGDGKRADPNARAGLRRPNRSIIGLQSEYGELFKG